MEKKILLILFLFCFSFAFADTISDYVVPANMPLNQKITAVGNFVDSNGDKSSFLCSFYFLDSSGNLVKRATDQYTTSTGRFAMNGIELKEPYFVRGEQYTLRSECGTTFADANFVVAQKQEAFDILGYKFYPQSLGFDLLFWKDDYNTIAFLLAIVIIGFCIYWLKIYTNVFAGWK